MDYCAQCQENHVTSDKCFEDVWCKFCQKVDYLKHECKKSRKLSLQYSNSPSEVIRELKQFRKRKSDSDLDSVRSFRTWIPDGNDKTKQKTENTTEQFLDYMKKRAEKAKEIIIEKKLEIMETESLESQSNMEDISTFEFDPKEEYTIVSIHIETFKTKNSSDVDLCQIGCSVVGGNSKKTFFKPIKPTRLHQFLSNYKMEGDLLKVLHMVNADGNKFEFREKIEEIKGEKEKQFCVSENVGLKDLGNFLKQFKNCILLAIDEETVQVILGKMEKEKIKMGIKGFFTWAGILNKLVPTKIGIELEDFYSEVCKEEIKTYSTALDVSSYLKKAFFKCIELTVPSLNIVKSADDLNHVPECAEGSKDSNENDTIEVYNSFRPSVSTKMSAMKMDTLEISSDSEDEKENQKISQIKQKIFTKHASTNSKSKQQQVLLKMPSIPKGIQINCQPKKSSPFVNPNIILTKSGVSSPRSPLAGITRKSTHSSTVLSSVINSPRISMTGVTRSPSITKTGVSTNRVTGTRISSPSPNVTTLAMKNATITKNPHLPSQQDKTYKSQKAQNLAWNQALLNRLCNSPNLSLSDRIGQAYTKHVTNDGKHQQMFKCGICMYKTAQKQDLELHWRFDCRSPSQKTTVKSI